MPASVDPDFPTAAPERRTPPPGGHISGAGVTDTVYRRRTPTLEEYASGARVAARYATATGADVTGAREVASRAAAGDGTAAAVLTSAGRALGAVLAWAVALLDPEAVVLGGGLGTAGGPLHDAALDTYAACCTRPDPPPVRRAGLGDRSGLLGAAPAVWERHDAGPSP